MLTWQSKNPPQLQRGHPLCIIQTLLGPSRISPHTLTRFVISHPRRRALDPSILPVSSSRMALLMGSFWDRHRQTRHLASEALQWYPGYRAWF